MARASKRPGTIRIDWRRLLTELRDSDGGRPDDQEDAKDLLREYRDYGSISGYWFFDPRIECDDDGMVYDPWHDEFRSPDMVGPAVEEIDWTGLN